MEQLLHIFALYPLRMWKPNETIGTETEKEIHRRCPCMYFTNVIVSTLNWE